MTELAYAPFGETAVTGPPSSSPVQFTGRENDGTGLYYYRARYYDPIRSRFVSEDPLGLAAGINRYVYTFNSPLSWVDRTGLDVTIIHSSRKRWGRSDNSHRGVMTTSPPSNGTPRTRTPVPH